MVTIHEQTPARVNAAVLDGASGVLAEIQASVKADTVTGTMVKHRILQTTPNVLRWKGTKRLTGKEKKEQRKTLWRCETRKRTPPNGKSAKDFVATE